MTSHTAHAALDAGILLVARAVLRRHGLEAPSAAKVLALTEAKPTTARKVSRSLRTHLESVLRPTGRPPLPPREPVQENRLAALRTQYIAFLMDNPGSVTGSAKRRQYSDRFRRFMLDLCQTHLELTISDISEATQVPRPTLKDWLSGKMGAAQPPEVPINAAIQEGPSPAHIECIVAAWRMWDGALVPFCTHVQQDLRIPFGRALIRDILHACEVRIPKSRRSEPDRSALKNGFETFFPGAQWVGDGTELAVEVDGEVHKCNLELLVDPDSGAFVGASVRPTEDAQAVVEAFDDAVESTGAPPLALLLDNKPSNHCPGVHDHTGETSIGRSRPYQPTDKPHVEGGFGLFKQDVPTMAITTGSPLELAMAVAGLVFNTWARAANHRPRDDRKKKSRFQLYTDSKPTPEACAAAKAALEARIRKQEKAREAKKKRLDPIVRELLDGAFARLDLEDPDEHLRLAIASWPVDAIIEGIAVYEGKKKAKSLPEGVDARYLRGIVRNIAQENEGLCIATSLLEGRLDAQDATLHLLTEQRELIDEQLSDDDYGLMLGFVDRALDAKGGLDRTFWLQAAADHVRAVAEPTERPAYLRVAARRIHTRHAVAHRARLKATRFLFAKALPVV